MPDPAHRRRFVFEPLRTERKDGIELVTLTFTEKDAPTLIAGLDRRPVFSKGQVTIEEATGVIRKVIFAVAIGGVSMELGTVYGRDAKLGIWVPTTFQERYQDGADPGTRTPQTSNGPRYETISCQARYTNFRRFETAISR